MKEDGFSALHLASLNGHHNVVQCLVEVRKLTYFLCCVPCNGVIWLKLIIFAHTLPAVAKNILRQKEAFRQEKSSTPTRLVWVTNVVSILFIYLFWQQHGGHGVTMWKRSFSNFSKSLLITMPSLKLIQSEKLEISDERVLLVWKRGLWCLFLGLETFCQYFVARDCVSWCACALHLCQLIGLANTYPLNRKLWGDQRYPAFEQPTFCFYCCYTMSLLLHYRLAQVLTSTFEMVVNRPLSSWL